jgi:UDP-N-acetylmuramoyl-tripeptide--D-alanyl-D-alanine ligase
VGAGAERAGGIDVNLAPQSIATAIGAEVAAEGSTGAPERAIVDSAEARAGDLFFGLRGERVDGGEFAAAAIGAGAWGAVVGPEHANRLVGGAERSGGSTGAWVFAVADPLAALQDLARAWRRELGARTVGVTGSVGKTSVKDIARALLPGRVHANRENLNTEIGLPLTVLEAAADTDLLVLEMAMRGPGQIAELASIAEPEVAVITNVGPVHVELLGSVEAIAAAKAEVLAALPAHGTAVVPVDGGELEAHLEQAPRLLRFGPGGDIEALERRLEEGVTEALISTPAGRQLFHFPFTEAHNLTNALAAVAVGVALEAPLAEMADRAANIGFSRFRGERLELGDGIVLVNDCYNANPVSMRAALDHLASLDGGRRIAVLGAMAELGQGGPGYHREVGEHARAHGVDLVVGVAEPARDYGPDELVASPEEAAELLAAQLEPGDAVLVKGSRSAGLEAVAEVLQGLLGAPGRGAGGESIPDSVRPRRPEEAPPDHG